MKGSSHSFHGFHQPILIYISSVVNLCSYSLCSLYISEYCVMLAIKNYHNSQSFHLIWLMFGLGFSLLSSK